MRIVVARLKKTGDEPYRSRLGGEADFEKSEKGGASEEGFLGR